MAHSRPLLMQLASSASSLLPRMGASALPEAVLAATCLSLRHLTTSSAWMMNAQPARQEQPQAESNSTGAGTSQQSQSQSDQQQEQQQQQQASTSTQGMGVNPEELYRRVNSAFKSGYESVRSTVGAGSSNSNHESSGSSSTGSNPGSGGHRQSLLHTLGKDMYEVFRPADNIRSATRKYTGPVMEFAEGDTTTTALQLVKQQKTSWQKMQEKIFDLPFLNKLRTFKVADTAAYKKGQEVVEDLKEKYETSDNPMVHKVDEVKERLMSGSESSNAMREVRQRDPSFDLNSFVRAIKFDAPVVVRALLTRDLDTLSLHVGPEMMERLGGIFKHEAERGIQDPHILFVSDVEIVEIRQMDGDPFVVAQFNCQQLKCVRDQFGNVVEGSPDSIQRVYYFWGLQQEKQGVVTADGQLLPPRWVIRDMMWQSMLALV